MDAIASLITNLTTVYSAVYSDADQSKHQSSASLAFVWGIHRGPVNSPHKWPVTRKMFPFDDVIMMNKLAIRLWMDGFDLNVILMFLPVWFCHTAAIVSTWQPVPEPINGVTRMWLSCFATCDWLRTLVHLHCEVMITTSTTKTWWSCRSLGVDLLCLRKKTCHQNTMLMRWKVCKFKDEDLKIPDR